MNPHPIQFPLNLIETHWISWNAIKKMANRPGQPSGTVKPWTQQLPNVAMALTKVKDRFFAAFLDGTTTAFLGQPNELDMFTKSSRLVGNLKDIQLSLPPITNPTNDKKLGG